MKKVNFLIIIVALILIFLSWLIVQAVFKYTMDSNQHSGEGTYTGPKKELILDACYKDLICLETPLMGENIISPLVVRGRARGVWFFEGDFPLVLTNWDGLIVAEGYATANGDWMTEKYVDFEGVLEFDVDLSVSNRGSLILQKDNPSGLLENDDALEVLIFFK